MPWCGASRGTSRPRSAPSAKVTGIAVGMSYCAAASRVTQIRWMCRSGLASAAATAWRPQKRGRFSGLLACRALRRMGFPCRAPRAVASVDRGAAIRHWSRLPIIGPHGQVAEWLKAADCKSARVSVRWFESSPVHHPPPPTSDQDHGWNQHSRPNKASIAAQKISTERVDGPLRRRSSFWARIHSRDLSPYVSR